MSDELQVIIEKANALLQRAQAAPPLEEIRKALNEAGVSQARRAQNDALDEVAACQERKREADMAERAAKKQLDDALLDADWALTPPDVNEAGAKLLAADKAAWKKSQAQKEPAVVKAAEQLRECEHATAVARDALTIADLRFKACRSDLEAAVATLAALTLALPARKATT